MSVEGLKAKLSELGLRTNERKGVLQNGLLDHYELNTPGSASDYNEAASTLTCVNEERRHFTLTYIEDLFTHHLMDSIALKYVSAYHVLRIM